MFISVCGLRFFFQAEDGIRDVAVTGVQTCALPISTAHFRARLGPVNSYGFAALGRLLGAPRILRKRLSGRGPAPPQPLQKPWLPLWPALEAKPLHRAADHAWTRALREASSDIRAEL